MKRLSLTIAVGLISIGLFAQGVDTPAMSRFAKMKSYSESQFKIHFADEAIPKTFIKRSDLTAEQLHKIKRDSLNTALDFIEKYSLLKFSVDEVIAQLKGDMVLANSRKTLKRLNQGVQDPNSWYGKKFEEIKMHYANFANAQKDEQAFSASSIPAITGIFTAVTGVVTSMRDHRLEKVKLLNDQLEGLRLKPYYELMDAKGKD